MNWHGLDEWQQWALGIGGSLAAAFIIWLVKRMFFGTSGRSSTPTQTSQQNVSPAITQNASPTMTQQFNPVININAAQIAGASHFSKLHEKEFEVLQKAWLMLNELRGAIVRALDLTYKSYPAFQSFSDEKLEACLREEIAAQRLNDYQASHLKTLGTIEKKNKFYMDAIMGSYLDYAENKLRLFNNFLIEHQIFMNDELRCAFENAKQALSSAFVGYKVGKPAGNWKMEVDAQNAMSDTKLQRLFDEVNSAIQKRLRGAATD